MMIQQNMQNNDHYIFILPAEVNSLPNGKREVGCVSDRHRIHVQYTTAQTDRGVMAVTIRNNDLQKVLHSCEGQSRCTIQQTASLSGNDVMTLSFVCTLVTNNGELG